MRPAAPQWTRRHTASVAVVAAAALSVLAVGLAGAAGTAAGAARGPSGAAGPVPSVSSAACAVSGLPMLPRLDRLAPPTVDSLLTALHARLPRFEDRLRALIAARIGVPYALGPLGEERAPDTDPVFRLDEADCTVLVLTTVALAHARTIDEARRWMGPANYRARGETYPVSYEDRLHFTSDRLLVSPLFENLTSRLAAPAERRHVRLTLNRGDDGSVLLPIHWQREVELDYVPAAHLEAVLERLPPVAGIAFLRASLWRRGVLVAHEGFVLDRRCLVHASSTADSVTAVDLLDYVFRASDPDSTRRGTPLFDGVLLYGLRDASAEVDPAAVTSFAAPDSACAGAAPLDQERRPSGR